MGFAENFEREAKKFGLTGDFYNWTEGDNRVRGLSTPEIYVSRFGKEFGACYEGAPYCKKEELEKAKDKNGKPAQLNKKWLCWAIIRREATEPELGLLRLPYKVMVQLKNLAQDTKDGYGFQDFPMPYDINIKVENAGETTAVYSVIPSKKETKITDEEMGALSKKTPVDQIIQKMKDKAKRKLEGAPDPADKTIDYPEEKINADDIPW